MNTFNALLEAATNAGVVRINRETFAVPSSTDEEGIYLVAWGSHINRFICVCRGFRFRDSCDHVARVKAYVRELEIA